MITLSNGIPILRGLRIFSGKYGNKVSNKGINNFGSTSAAFVAPVIKLTMRPTPTTTATAVALYHRYDKEYRGKNIPPSCSAATEATVVFAVLDIDEDTVDVTSVNEVLTAAVAAVVVVVMFQLQRAVDVILFGMVLLTSVT